MAILDVRKYPDPVLKQPCAEATAFGAELHELLDDMRETMYAAEGIGLAAPQVGVSSRIVVIDVGEDEPEPLELINPKIVKREGKVPSEEGCLSIPGFRETIERSKTVAITALDREGRPFELEADGILAICIQHEVDHLDGVLFIDHLSRLKRELFRRWYKKNMAAAK